MDRKVRTNIKGMSGLEVLTGVSDGRIDHPSMAYTLGFRLTEVEAGRAINLRSSGCYTLGSSP